MVTIGFSIRCSSDSVRQRATVDLLGGTSFWGESLHALATMLQEARSVMNSRSIGKSVLALRYRRSRKNVSAVNRDHL